MFAEWRRRNKVNIPYQSWPTEVDVNEKHCGEVFETLYHSYNKFYQNEVVVLCAYAII